MRAKFNAAPIQTQKLAGNVAMLSGPGGSVVVLNGPDGKFVVDTFVAPAWPKLKATLHTDSDIYVHFQKANVISMGDLFFNGMYPYIDPGTGGSITGNIAACDKILSLAGNSTKIVPGPGPLGNKADLTKFRDMLVTARDRVQKLKSAGKSAQEGVAEKPFADLGPVWCKGIINSNQFVQIVYLTL
jgi:hypothetical protein